MSTSDSSEETDRRVSFSGVIINETEKSLHIDIKGRSTHWLPRSKMYYKADANNRIEFSIPHWLAKDKGLI